GVGERVRLRRLARRLRARLRLGLDVGRLEVDRGEPRRVVLEVDAARAGEDGPLERRDRARDPLARRRPLADALRLELVALDPRQAGDDVVELARHLDGVLDRSERLLREARRAPVPELDLAEDAVEDARRLPAALLPADALREAARVGEALRRDVAA